MAFEGRRQEGLAAGLVGVPGRGVGLAAAVLHVEDAIALEALGDLLGEKRDDLGYLEARVEELAHLDEQRGRRPGREGRVGGGR
ncbi:hypothetical protein D3C72_1787150 [compost metagenome]